MPSGIGVPGLRSHEEAACQLGRGLPVFCSNLQLLVDSTQEPLRGRRELGQTRAPPRWIGHDGQKKRNDLRAHERDLAIDELARDDAICVFERARHVEDELALRMRPPASGWFFAGDAL